MTFVTAYFTIMVNAFVVWTFSLPSAWLLGYRPSSLYTFHWINMKLKKYSEEQLRTAVSNSTSRRQVLQKLKVKAAGGNYQTLNKAIKYFEIDTSHFKGQAWNKGLQLQPKRDIQVYLDNQFPIQSYKLKKRLLKEGYFEQRCSSCNGTTWLGKPIPVELDHINGNHKDNSFTNLRLLCPNCHAQTPTYRGKNKKQQ